MSDTNTITCPHCKADFPLGEAVSKNLRSELSAEFDRERQRLNAALAERENLLAAGAEKLEAREKAVADEIAKRMEAERTKLREAAVREAAENSSIAIRDLQEQLVRQTKRVEESQAAELEIRKKQRELEEAKATMELEMARKIDGERLRIAETARIDAARVEALKLADKDNKIKDLTDQIAALQKRAEQGSMQAQGETLELVIESTLRAAFPYDEIAEVKKGQRGADCLQNVRTNNGQDCGSILWEAKRAAKWSNDWPDKLKEDQREAKADLAVIVTTCPPAGVRGIGQSEGVWICEPSFASALAAALRQGLVSTAVQRFQQSNSTDKMTLLYNHLCSVGFRQNIEAIVETFVGFKEQLDTEKRAFAKQWKERETQIEKAITHTAALYTAGSKASPGGRRSQKSKRSPSRSEASGTVPIINQKTSDMKVTTHHDRRRFNRESSAIFLSLIFFGS